VPAAAIAIGCMLAFGPILTLLRINRKDGPEK
jgi:hypothetical protein